MGKRSQGTNAAALRCGRKLGAGPGSLPKAVRMVQRLPGLPGYCPLRYWAAGIGCPRHVPTQACGAGSGTLPWRTPSGDYPWDNGVLRRRDAGLVTKESCLAVTVRRVPRGLIAQKRSPWDSKQNLAGPLHGFVRSRVSVETQVIDFQRIHSMNQRQACRGHGGSHGLRSTRPWSGKRIPAPRMPAGLRLDASGTAIPGPTNGRQETHVKPV